MQRIKAALAGLMVVMTGLLLAPAAGWSADREGASWPAVSDASLDSTQDEQRVVELVSKMSLEEKVGQMLQADIASVTPADVRDYRLGAVLAGGGAAPHGDVRAKPQAWLDLVAAMHRAALQADSSVHPAIPLLFGIDAVHGDAKLIGATIFPHNIGLGAAHDPGLIEAIGTATAEEVASAGIDWTFAPTVAVARDVRWGRAYESYSESPELVSRYAAAMVTGLQGRPGSDEFIGPAHTLSSIKHYIGDGATIDGRDQGDAEIPEAELARVHGAGYAAAIPAGALIVMASYNSWHGLKVNASHYLLTDVLKGRMGFRGFVVGDWNAHEQIPGCTKYSCPTAILAGVDMLMAPDSWKPLYFNTIAQVRSGVIPMARIDDAVTRILRVKALAGGSVPRNPELRPPLSVLGSPAHRALAREAVRRSLVLLKNNRAILPLRPDQHILVAGAAADDLSAQSGGWTVDWQGDHNTKDDFPGATSLLKGIEALVSSRGGSVQFSAQGNFKVKPDIAIVVYGEGPYAEFEGDRENLILPDTDGHLRLLRRLHAAGIPVVSVLLSGRPLWVSRELNLSDAFVAAWLPGSEGEGLADVLFRGADGKAPYDFSGRLSFSWPASAYPVKFSASGAPGDALFARGYGLDYTHPRELARLSEASALKPEDRVEGTLFHAAHVTAPWSIYLSDELAEVRLTSRVQQSPAGYLVILLQDRAVTAHWSAGAPSLFRIAGRAVDLRAGAARGLSLTLHYRVLEAPSAAVRIGVRCASPYARHPPEPTAASAESDRAAQRCGTVAGATVDVTDALLRAADGGWHRMTIPMSCLTRQGALLADVEAPLVITTSAALSLSIDEVRLEPASVQDCTGTEPDHMDGKAQ